MNDVFLLLGSNIDDRVSQIQRAVEAIDDTLGRVVSTSKLYETQAWGKEDQNAFINLVIRVICKQQAQQILRAIKKIEKLHNRKTVERWGPRCIDIDILFYNDEVIVEEDLCIPHKLLHKRRFALVPLNEIVPNKVHPAYSKTVNTLLYECTDTLDVFELNAAHVRS